MRIIDVSLDVSADMMVWPSDPPVEVRRTKHLDRDGSNVSEIRLGTHAGTHVDPPAHFADAGATVDALPLEALVGPAVVVDMRDVGEDIERKHLEDAGVGDVSRLLFKTRNSELWAARPQPFPESYTALSPDGARWLVERRVRLVGTDFLSIERRGAPGHPTHTTLLTGGAVILEGLDLSAVEPGAYTLVCLPLKIAAGDGAPARAILIEG